MMKGIKKAWVWCLAVLLACAAVLIQAGCEEDVEREGLNRASDMWGANAQRTGRYDTEALTKLHGLKWSDQAEGNTIYTPCVAQGKLYIAGFGGPVLAYDALTGKELWRYGEGVGDVSDPCYADGLLYIGYGKSFIALNGETGEGAWEVTTDDFCSSPCTSGGLVFFGCGEGLYALDKSDGKLVWKFETEGRVVSSPTVLGGTVFIGDQSGALHAIDIDTGSETWSFKGGGPFRSTACAADGYIYIGCGDHYMYALDAATGKEMWRFDTGGSPSIGLCLLGGYIFFGVMYGINSGCLFSLDKTTGEVAWKLNSGVEINSAPSTAGGIIYSEGGFNGPPGTYGLYAIQAETGEVLWSEPSNHFIHMTPCVAGGMVFYGDDWGYIFALY